MSTNNQTNLPKSIIQVLLWEGGTLKMEYISKFLNVKISEIKDSILEIENLLAILDLSLIKNNNSLEIALSPAVNSLISKQKLEELRVDLSESALQTLAVIMYKNKSTRAEINFIRGVDSARSIKNLLNRGLIETTEEKNRRYYMPTTETLRYLDLSSAEELPEREEITEKLKTLMGE